MKVAEAKTPATAAKSNSPFFQKGAAQSLLTAEEAPQPFFQKKQNDHVDVQAKLNIGQPNDKYEQEADAMADKVVQKLSTGNDVSEKKSPDNIQAKPLAADITPLVQQKHEQGEEEKLQKKEEADPLKAALQQKPVFESNAEALPDADVQRKCDACEHEEEEKVQKKPDEAQVNDKQIQEANSIAEKAVQLQPVPAAVKVNDASADIQAKHVAAAPAVQKAAAFDEEEKQKKEEEGDQQKGELQKKPVFEGNAEAPPDDEKDVQRKCDACEHEEEKGIQKKEGPGAADVASSSVESSLSSSKGSGSPLPESTRSEMEDSFGADFSGVRIHNDSSAAQMSADLNAQAFTHQNDIYFNNDKYNPQTTEGRHLLAHELTHTIQQGGAASKEQHENTVTEQVAPKIQRGIIDDVASHLLTGNAALDFLVGVGAGIVEWFGDLISGIGSLIGQALDLNVGAILALAGIIIVIVLACFFPEVVIPILIGIGIVMGLISMAYFLYMMTRPGLTPYERGKYLGKAIVEAALLAFTVLEAVRLLKTFAEVAKLAEGVGLLQRLRWVRQLMRFGETAKVLEILAEIRDVEKTIEFLTIVNDVSKAQELLRLARGAGEFDILMDILRMDGILADDVLEFMRFTGMTIPDLRDLLRTPGMTPDILREMFALNGMTAAKLRALLALPGMTVAELRQLLGRPGMTVDILTELMGKPGMTVVQLNRLISITDSIEQLRGFFTRIENPTELERLINSAGLTPATPDALRLERALNNMPAGTQAIPDVEAALEAQKRIDRKILFGEQVGTTPGTADFRTIRGAHSPRILTDPNYTILSSTANADGTTVVRFQRQVAPGVLSKPKTSTLAPSSWTDNDILRAGDTVGNEPVALGPRASDGATLRRGMVNGVQWEVIKDGSGRLTSSYPTGGTPSASF